MRAVPRAARPGPLSHRQQLTRPRRRGPAAVLSDGGRPTLFGNGDFGDEYTTCVAAGNGVVTCTIYHSVDLIRTKFNERMVALEAARQAGEAEAAAARGGTAGRSCSADKPKSERARYIALGVLFGSWYACNIAYNVFNKQVLLVFPYPATCTAAHGVVAAAAMGCVWLAFGRRRDNGRSRPTAADAAASAFSLPRWATPHVLAACAPLAALHAAGLLATNMSLGSVAVSFTHTIKALEPFFTVLLSATVLGATPAVGQLLALVPIVAGVIIASVTEISFTWAGFLAAMASNLAFQGRNVLSKAIMQRSDFEPHERLGGIDMFGLVTFMALPLLVGVVPLLEGFGPTAAALTTPGVALPLILAGIARCGDVLVSYAILHRVMPVTHSVGNCVKRVSVILVSLIVFHTPITPANGMGTALALAGVLAYSLAKGPEKTISKRVV